MKRTYVAVTTTNPRYGWYEVARGGDKKTVEAEARTVIGDAATGYGSDIYKDTQHTNLRIVSKTEAKRSYGVDIKKLQCNC